MGYLDEPTSLRSDAMTTWRDSSELASTLSNYGLSCPASAWPGSLPDLQLPGLYAWWIDSQGAATASERLGETITPGIVYVGQAGAAKGQANVATLGSRLAANHLYGKIRSSTFRLTIAAILLEEIQSSIVDDRKLDALGEKMVSHWIARHFHLTIAPLFERADIFSLEKLVLAELNPVLNLDGMPQTPLRKELSRRRKVLRCSSHSDNNEIVLRKQGEVKQGNRVTLHEEISEILVGINRDWISTAEIAQIVNERGIYRKRDNSPITAFQIHGRTRNYPQLFDRDGSLVRLKRVRQQ